MALMDGALVALLAAGAALAAVWGSIRSWFDTILVLPVTTVSFPTGYHLEYFANHMARTWGGRTHYDCWMTRRGSEVTDTVSAATASYGTCIGFYGWVPFVAMNSGQNDPGRIMFLRGTVDVDKLAIAVTTNWARAVRMMAGNRFGVTLRSGMGSIHARNSGGDKGPSVGVPIDNTAGALASRLLAGARIEDLRDTPRSLSRLYHRPSAMAPLQERVTRWLASKAWFAAHELPWRFGALLTGAPGTGKSTFVIWLAEKLGLPVEVFDLASMSNTEFMDSWTAVASKAPCFVLFEDIDAVFDQRVNTLGELGGGLSFDCLLNALSGVNDASGLAVFITTNHPEKVDEALRYRPGRVDAEVEVPGLEDAGLEHVASILIERPETRARVVAEFVGSAPPAAVFKNRCVELALQDEALKHT